MLNTHVRGPLSQWKVFIALASEEDEGSTAAKRGNKKCYLKINIQGGCYLFYFLFQHWINDMHQEMLDYWECNKPVLS